MIPLYRCSNMEQTVNLLAKHFRCVLVDAAYWCSPAIRLRADALDGKVYFARTQSQVALWQTTGGVLIRWDRKPEVGAHDAIFFAECPRKIEFLDRLSQDTRSVAVIYQPPTWRVHFETLDKRFAKKWRKRRSEWDALERMKQLLESSEIFTSVALARLLRAHQGEIVPPSSAPVLSEGAARAPGTTHGVP